MLNHIVVMGRFTRNPEMRSLPSGTSVASFAIAVDRDYKDKVTGETPTDFFEVVVFGARAETVSRFFEKGSMAIVEGRLQIDVVDKNGQKNYYTKINADKVHFGETRREAEARRGGGGGGGYSGGGSNYGGGGGSHNGGGNNYGGGNDYNSGGGNNYGGGGNNYGGGGNNYGGGGNNYGGGGNDYNSGGGNDYSSGGGNDYSSGGGNDYNSGGGNDYSGSSAPQDGGGSNMNSSNDGGSGQNFNTLTAEDEKNLPF